MDELNLPTDRFETWAVVELMGHVKMAGRVTEEERFGGKLGRIDIPDESGDFSTQYFGFASVYRLTVVTEEVARFIASRNKPAPIYSWDLDKVRALKPAPDPDAIDAEPGGGLDEPPDGDDEDAEF
jgi:hypothetical protein